MAAATATTAAPATVAAPERKAEEAQKNQSSAKTAFKVAIVALAAITAVTLGVLAFAFPVIPGVAAAILFTACLLVGAVCLIDVFNPSFPRYYHTSEVVYAYTPIPSPPVVVCEESPLIYMAGPRPAVRGHHVAVGRGDVYRPSARHVPPVRTFGFGGTIPRR